jgi:hypothetical protein
MNIAIELTLRCNIKCPNCDRFCNNESKLGMTRSSTDLQPYHIDFLCNEIRKKDKGFIHKIELIGGEPTLSNCIEYAIDKIEGLMNEGYVDKLHVITNEFKPITNEKILKYVKNRIPIKDKARKHKCVYVCPQDDGLKGTMCKVPRRCGIVFNVYGFSIGGHCSTVLEFFQIRKYFVYNLPNDVEDFKNVGNYEEEVCSRCSYGINGGKNHWNKSEGEVYGKTYLEQIETNKNGFVEPNKEWIKEFIFG